MIKTIQEKSIGLGLSFLGLGIISALIMYFRTQQELLWSYWTLSLLFFTYLGLSLLWWRKSFKKDSATVIFYLKATLSGLLLALAFPFSNLPSAFIVLFAFVPLMQVINTMQEQKARPRLSYFYSLHCFMLWNIIATYWVGNSSLPAGLFAIIVNSLIMGLPVWLYYRTSAVMPKLAWVPLVAYWLSFEYMHFHWELNWPWLTLGNTWATSPELVQWYSFTGVLGGSLWILLCNIFLFNCWQAYQKKEKYKPLLLRSLLLILLPMFSSLLLYFSYEEQGESRTIVLAQPNIEPFYEEELLSPDELMERLLTIGLDKLDKQSDYLVYPEASLSFSDQNNLARNPQIKLLDQNILSKYPNLSLIIGTDAYRFLAPDEKPGRYSRKQENKGQSRYFEVYNAALQLSTGLDSIAFYKKSKLVPGAELFPYPQVFSFLKPLIEGLGGTMAGRGAQKERIVFSSDKGKVVPAICYESVFGEHIAAHVRNGGEAIFIITNDAWWDKTAGHRQHFHYARLRAIENRRSIARSANTGISTLINQRGDILLRSKYRATDSLKGNIQFNQAISFYSQNPNTISRFAVFAALAFFLNLLAKGVFRKKEAAANK